MQDEIFGPILPLVAVDSVDAAIDYVNARPRPLALYHFDNDSARTERVLERTIAGGVSINDTVLHFAQSELPFGGVGPSGMGHYHGREGFLTFSKQKPVLYQARFSGMVFTRPPYRQGRGFPREVFDALTRAFFLFIPAMAVFSASKLGHFRSPSFRVGGNAFALVSSIYSKPFHSPAASGSLSRLQPRESNRRKLTLKMAQGIKAAHTTPSLTPSAA